MLNKLLKYDLKYVYKVLVVFYILSLIFSIFTRVLFLFDDSIIFNVLAHICSGVTISFIFNILINNIMRLWSRFIKNIYSDESYLTHTLPVKKNLIYISKFLSSVITMFTSAATILLVLFIAYYSKENLEIVKNSLDLLATVYNSTVINLLLVIFLMLFIEMVFIIQVGYVGILLGHKSLNNRVLKSIIYGFGCYILTQILSLIIIFLVGFFNRDIMNLFVTNDMININIIKIIMVCAIILYGGYLYIYYIVGFKLFKKGIDVE